MEQPQKQRRAILHRMLKARIRSLEGNDWLGYLPYNSVVTRELLEPVCSSDRNPTLSICGNLVGSAQRTVVYSIGIACLLQGIDRVEHYWMKQCASYLGPIQLNASVSSRGWLTKDGMAKSFRLDNPNTSG
ncbi:uncharacterized protein CIMG_07306 [Coccidioides immitis RS]|uniref:Uncharacterized protein n=1 Tax=Coccidioides immitis (strain RS) TaxID=246410 RepID=J3KA23_COCIM|nr:uncharacterized protein CIMG_07306 [Coccidioides immitis RS]EAS31827.3 hypothetical protein CIMG_07306 [Coccidioides immitis RS]